MAKTPFELYLDTKKKKQEPTTFREASVASRVQYTNPQYSGKSTSKSYKWESELLGGLKGKGVGKNNTEKFDNITRSMGLSESDARELRRYLDHKEDSQKEIKLNKDGSISKNQTVPMGQGSKTQQQLLESIVKTGNQRVQTQIELQEKKKKQEEKAVKDKNTTWGKVKSFLTGETTINGELNKKNTVSGVYGSTQRVGKVGKNEKATEIDRALNRFADPLGVQEHLARKTGDKKTVDAFYNQRDFGKGGGTDIVSDLASMLLPGGAAVKGARMAGLGAKAADKGVKRLGKTALEGSVVGTALAGAEIAAREGINPEAYNAKENLMYLGQNALGGAIIDPAVDGVLRNLNLKGQLDELFAQTGSSKFDEQKLAQAYQDTFAQKGNPVNVLAPKPTEIPKPFEKKYNLQTNVVSSAPKTFDEADLDFQKEVFDRRQAEEDAFVQAEMAPFDDMLKRSSEADMVWNDSVKKSKDMVEQIKQNYGKIVVPEGNWADWGHEVPVQFRAKRGTNESGIDLYRFAEDEGFSSVDEAVQFLKTIDAESKTKLKDLKPTDDMKIKPEDYDGLVEVTRKKFAESDNGKAIDKLLEDLMGAPKNSQSFKLDVPVEKQPSLDPYLVAQKEVAPTVEAPPITEPKLDVEKPREFMLRSNLQAFNTPDGNSMVSTSTKKETVSVIDSIKNPVMRKIHKFYEGYVSRTHSAKLLDKEYGSELDKTLQNEAAGGSMAKNFLDRHFSALQKAVKVKGSKTPDKDLADALEYQMAKNLLFNKQKNPDYKLPQGWDWERLAAVEGAGAGKYDEFTNSFRSLTQEWRDTMLEYGMIDKAAYDALGENPFYIPMYRDLEFKKDNIDLGAGPGKRQGKRGADPLILHDWEAGDLNTFYANPLETVITNTFKLYNNALKNDTGLQFKKIAEADSEGMFVKKITEKEYQSGGGVEVFVNGTKEYYRPQSDLRDLMDELDTGLELDAVGKATALYARLKTSSLEYQTGAVLRDLAQSFVTSQAGPIRYLQHAVTAIKNKNANAEKIGATFHQAYSDHVGGIDPNKVTQEYAKQNAHVNNIDLKNKAGLKTLGNVLLKVLELPLKPAQKIGQWSDNLPREIEVLEAQRRFQKQHGAKISEMESRIAEIDNQIVSAQGAPDFDPSTQGIDNLAQERTDLDNQLMEFKRDLRREEIYRARDVINYSRMGRGKVAQKIRQYVIFANTTTQSKDKIIRSFIERPGVTLAKAGIATAPFIAAQQMMMDNMSSEDRKLYDETPDYIKNFNYVFVSDGSVYTLPKVHELALITNPMEQAMAGESLASSGQNAVKELVPYQIGNLAQGLVPKDGKVDMTDNGQLPGTVASPLIDVFTNQKTGFNQKPISYGDLRRDKEGIKANKWTNEALKIISNSPKADYSEYLIRQYGGDAGKYGLAGLDYLASDKKDRTDRLLEQINPIQDRVYKENNKWLKDPIRVEKK